MALQNIIGGGTDSGLLETGISAAGTTQATATQLRAQNSDVSTVSVGSGVILNSLLPGMLAAEQTVFNSSTNALKVYPPSGMQINALTTNVAINLSPKTGILFIAVSATRVFGVLSA
jgi:hypothetical protein